MRLYFLLLFSCLMLISCSSSPKKRITENYDKHETPFVKEIDESSLLENKKSNIFSKMGYQHNLIYVSLSNINNEKIFRRFGESIGKYGVVFILKDKSKTNKKLFLSEVFKKLKSSYEYYDSPFLLFFDKKGNPHEIMSFKGVDEECTVKFLDRIENSIYQGVNNRSLVTNFEKIKFDYCKYEPKIIKSGKTIIELIIDKVLSGK